MAKRKYSYLPDKKKMEVVTTYLITGNETLTAAATGITRETVRQWRKHQWWKDMELEIRDSENVELSARLKKVIDKSVDVLQDRLENGDHMFDPKTGKIIRVPVKVREALKAVDSMIDKRQLLMDKPTRITEQRTVEDRLNKLAEEFQRFAAARTIEHSEADLPPYLDVENAPEGV